MIYSAMWLQIQFNHQESKKSISVVSRQQQKVSRLDEANLETIYNLLNDSDELSPRT